MIIVSDPNGIVTLTHLETSAPTKDQITQRHADIIINHFGMSLRCIVVTINCHWTYNPDSWSIWRNDYNALLEVCTLVVGVTFSKHQVHFRSWVASTTNEPVRVLWSLQ